MAVEKIETQIKKKEKRVKQICELKGINFKEWYLKKLEEMIDENLDDVFELIGK
ncbi:MAG: hypothetical protein NSGCLCUN01_03908 [uncultured Clostridium sp.]